MLHDDDELYPGGVAKMAARLNDVGDVGLVLGGVHFIDQAGVKQHEWTPNRGDPAEGKLRSWTQAWIRDHFHPEQCFAPTRLWNGAGL